MFKDEFVGWSFSRARKLLQLRNRQDPDHGGHQRSCRLLVYLHLLRVLCHVGLRRQVKISPGYLKS